MSWPLFCSSLQATKAGTSQIPQLAERRSSTRLDVRLMDPRGARTIRAPPGTESDSTGFAQHTCQRPAETPLQQVPGDLHSPDLACPLSARDDHHSPAPRARHAVLGTAAEAFLGLPPDRTVPSWNAAAEELQGWTA